LEIRRLILLVSVAAGLSTPIASTAWAEARSPREIQQALTDRGFDLGTPDGKWGRKSIAALRAFQKANGIKPTGEIDQTSLDALFALPAAAAPAEPTLDGTQSPPPPPNSRPRTESQPAAPQSVAPSQPPVSGDVPVTPVTPDRSVPSSPPPSSVTAPAETVPRLQPSASSEESPDQTNNPDPQQGGGGGVLIAIGIVAALIYWYRKRKKRASVAAALNAGNGWSPEYAKLVAAPLQASRPSADVTPVVPATTSSLKAHDTQVTEWVNQRAAFGNRSATIVPFKKASRSSSRDDSSWISRDTSITVDSVTIRGGLIYVGRNLRKQGSGSENENCLVNPGLAVSRIGDPQGQTLGYWPSYSTTTPAARRTYLEWLGGSRSDPSTPIGFVFLYFYGLERRLMLDPVHPDASEVVDEVRRLLGIYGGHRSFNQYASDLFASWHLKNSSPDDGYIPEIEGNGYEVPLAIKIALGIRVRDGREIEPDLLLRYAMSHPETRIRTPAKRAAQLHRALFVAEVRRRYPQGLKIAAGRAKTVRTEYRACSGSFTVSIEAAGGSVPDITTRAEPINTARTIFEACSDQLDDYSRALGRSAGLQPSLVSVAKLPAFLRRTAAESLPDQPMSALDALAASRSPVSLSHLEKLSGVEIGLAPTKPKLREMSQTLSALGVGNTADPAYALKNASADEAIVVFQLASMEPAEPSDAFRAAQLSSMLGMIVGHADGHFHDNEKTSLLNVVANNPTLSADERTRLAAEIDIHEREPNRLDIWVKKLKDVPDSGKQAIAAELVSVATSDGVVSAAEVRKLEDLFKKMGLDRGTLYASLHDSGGKPRPQEDDDLDMVLKPGNPEVGSRIPVQPEPKKAAQTIDLSRLNSIRSETRVTAMALAQIFQEDEEPVEELKTAISEQSPHDAENDAFDGLELRYSTLLMQLAQSPAWSAADFDETVRAAGLMPGAAREAINDWALDKFDELLIEGEDPIEVNLSLLPQQTKSSQPGSGTAEGISA